jgi:hypothetical protein
MGARTEEGRKGRLWILEIDDTEGNSAKIKAARPTDEDDVEGQLRGRLGQTEGDDTEGQVRAHLRPEGDDTEGHGHCHTCHLAPTEDDAQGTMLISTDIPEVTDLTGWTVELPDEDVDVQGTTWEGLAQTEDDVEGHRIYN